MHLYETVVFLVRWEYVRKCFLAGKKIKDMNAKLLRSSYVICALAALLLNILGVVTFVRVQVARGQDNSIATIRQQLQSRRVAPFMYRPYYGNRTVLQRTISFVDHDKPWYEDDNTFVRYDGRKWTRNDSVSSCMPGVSCYDGHNGYDLGLRFEPVLSAAAGTVIRANWYNPLNHNSALGLWAAIDHGNGMVTAYGHLSALTVSVGDYVGRQWQIGTSGTTGAATGPHLHFATYYMPYWLATDPFGWEGNYPDPNVVPDHYLWVNGASSAGNVPNLSAHGQAVYPGATVVDDGDPGWSRTGFWRRASSQTSIHDTLHWTATASTGVTATATWRPAIPADGDYEVGVFVDDTHASSSWVPYTVYSVDPRRADVEVQHTVYLDESHIGRFSGPFGTVSTGPQWVSIGTYYFRSSMDARVVVSNNTGEIGQQMAADGVEFARVGGGIVSGGGKPVNGSVPAPRITPVPAKVAPQHAMLQLPHAPLPYVPAVSTAHGSDEHVPTTARSYYFAEGYTGPGTTEELALTNLGSAPAHITIMYIYQHAEQKALVYQLAGLSHRILNINQEAGANQSVSMIVQGDQPFVAERTMHTQKESFAASTDSMGSASLSTNWYFAEGNTTFGWNTLLAVLNPQAVPVMLRLTTLPSRGNSGATIRQQTLAYSIPAQSRTTLVLDNAIANQQFGMVITASRAIAVERAEYLVVSPQRGGDAVVGVTAPQTLWYFGAGNTSPGFTERLVLANPASDVALAQLRYLMTDGRSIVQSVRVPGLSRIEVNVNRSVQQGNHATVINANMPLVAEQQNFFTTNIAGSVIGSTTAMGSTAAHMHWYVSQGNTSVGCKDFLALANPGALATTIHVAYLRATGVLLSRTYVLAAHTRGTIALANDVGLAQSVGVTITADQPVVAAQEEFFNQPGASGGYVSPAYGD